jgi:hypothetical protein
MILGTHNRWIHARDTLQSMRIMSSEEQEDKQWLVVTTTTMASKLWLNVVLCVCGMKELK